MNAREFFDLIVEYRKEGKALLADKNFDLHVPVIKEQLARIDNEIERVHAILEKQK